MIKSFIPVVLFLLALIVGAAVTYLILSTQTSKHIPKETTTVRKNVPKFSVENPPSQSLTGTIVSFSGGVKWQSRTAIEAAVLEKEITLRQGEGLETTDGEITLGFLSCQIHMSPKSKLNIIQTLPVNLVFEQTAGEITYQASCSKPLSVRSGTLLIQKNTGSMLITLDEKQNTIQIDNTNGDSTIGFNSATSKTTLISLPEQTAYLFDRETKKGTQKKMKTITN